MVGNENEETMVEQKIIIILCVNLYYVINTFDKILPFDLNGTIVLHMYC